jgi:diphosphate-dependent phosphofructokinase
MFAKKTLEITDEVLASYKNQGTQSLFCILVSFLSPTEFHMNKLNLCEGGYDLIGRSVDQIRTTEQVNATIATCTDLKLDGLVIIGGNLNQILTSLPFLLFCAFYNLLL